MRLQNLKHVLGLSLLSLLVLPMTGAAQQARACAECRPLFQNGLLNVAPVVAGMGRANTVMNPWVPFYANPASLTPSTTVPDSSAFFSRGNIDLSNVPGMFTRAPQFVFGRKRFDSPGFSVPQ